MKKYLWMQFTAFAILLVLCTIWDSVVAIGINSEMLENGASRESEVRLAKTNVCWASKHNPVDSWLSTVQAKGDYRKSAEWLKAKKKGAAFFIGTWVGSIRYGGQMTIGRLIEIRKSKRGEFYVYRSEELVGDDLRKACSSGYAKEYGGYSGSRDFPNLSGGGNFSENEEEGVLRLFDIYGGPAVKFEYNSKIGWFVTMWGNSIKLKRRQ